ncbi:MAG: tetratricopeptide repeat protein [Acidobacteria bacterium]|nr:tetratricopeptide repeat protein [Acidobacteriota bacterium]
MGDPTGRARVDRARDLSNTAWRLRSETLASLTNPAEGKKTARLVRQQLKEAVDLCREAEADRELATALRRLGHAEQDAGRIEAATARYEEAVVVARRTGDPLLQAHAIRHLGDAHRAARRLAAAETCYDEALALYAAEDEPPPLDYANAIRPMALLKEALGETDDARLLWQRAKTLYAAVPIGAGVAECEENLTRLPRSHSRGRSEAEPA